MHVCCSLCSEYNVRFAQYEHTVNCAQCVVSTVSVHSLHCQCVQSSLHSVYSLQCDLLPILAGEEEREPGTCFWLQGRGQEGGRHLHVVIMFFFVFCFLRGLDERKQEPIDALFEVLGMTTF